MDNYEKAVLFICNFKVRGMLYEQAKECALIAIDEVIDACEINMVESYNTDWWNKVKKEINNLK